MRRLITLISASRNRIIVIRRELPRTENADWVRKPYRTKHRRILLSVSPGPVTRSAEEFIRRGDSNRKLRCRPTGGGRSGKPGKIEPAIFSCEERCFCIAAGSSPGRAQRVGRIEEPGRVGAMRHKGRRENG